MLTGFLKTKIDKKGRIFLGSRARQEIGQRAFVIYGDDFHLRVVPEKHFKEIERRISELTDLATLEGFFNVTDADALKLQRNFYSLQAEVEVDEQGRITIPKFLRELVFLSDEVKVFSVGKWIEIWNAERAPRLEGVSFREAFAESARAQSLLGGAKEAKKREG